MSGRSRRGVGQQVPAQQQLNPPVQQNQHNAHLPAPQAQAAPALGVDTPTLSAFEEIAAARGDEEGLSRPDARSAGAQPQLRGVGDYPATNAEDRTSAFRDIEVANATRAGETRPRHFRNHPLYPEFEKRVAMIRDRVPPGFNVFTLADELWSTLFKSVERTELTMMRRDIYSNYEQGWVELDAPGFQLAIERLDAVIEKLGAIAESQFADASSFGFWSHGSGRTLAEDVTDVTLETSSLGFLFDGISSLDGGRDTHLWGALSQQYATMVGEQLGGDKEVHVCVGPNVRDNNIFAMIESPALEQALPEGVDFESHATYHGAAVLPSEELNPNVRRGEFPGTVYSGDSLADAKRAATDHLDSLTTGVRGFEPTTEQEQG